jgi:hypothetical protein
VFISIESADGDSVAKLSIGLAKAPPSPVVLAFSVTTLLGEELALKPGDAAEDAAVSNADAKSYSRPVTVYEKFVPKEMVSPALYVPLPNARVASRTVAVTAG